MNKTDIKLTIGSLLHDVGKVIYRKGDDKRNHSISGYDYLKDNFEIDKEILDCVRYHHAQAIKSAKIADDALAYIVYIADNIASAADRRKAENDEMGFELHMPLSPVFNILNNNNKKYYYEPNILNYESNIKYPIKEKKKISEEVYSKIKMNLDTNLSGIEWNTEYINSLLEVLEANMSYIPSSTAKDEVSDISLYDHVKLTAAFACAIKKYLDEKNIYNYRQYLYSGALEFYSEKAFLLSSLDISGIQKFIYTISTKNALKTLRSRSFYLELMMEHIIDMLLNRLELSRANLLYCGGGHCYLILPNTQVAVRIFNEVLDEINSWFLSEFNNELYIGGGYTECSSDMLQNIPVGSYKEVFLNTAINISKNKLNRYSAQDIIKLNSYKTDDYARECQVCKRIGMVNDDNKCVFCEKIEQFSKQVLYADFFSIEKNDSDDGLRLPGGYIVNAGDENFIKERMLKEGYIRGYGKNRFYSGKYIASKLWVGDYTTGDTLEQFANLSKGIKRIGVLRADVDDLGQTFISGFDNTDNNNKYSTLSRTATFSRAISLFFKHYINIVLQNGKFSLFGDIRPQKNVTIVYSGGDDLFIVGAWDEIIEAAIDIHDALYEYTEDTLRISAGIGIYGHGYPISVIADEVAQSENRSKNNDKNSITIFGDKTFKWDVFKNNVVKEKLQIVKNFFDSNIDYGKSFLYKIFELLRKQDEKINFARYVYLISRMEPDDKEAPDIKEDYKIFADNMIKWVHNKNDIEQLKTAIMLYVYSIRESEENHE